ncbi:MAG: DUF4139 domain-containing protein [Anaerolineae bacterium]|nr:DUF4139 domain-containing protein [Anaerolineae bacterium]
MRKLLPITLIVALFALAGMLVIPAAAQESQPEGVSLTIYNQGTALVQDRRTFDLQTGINTLDFTDVATGIDATSVSFKSLTDPLGTTVLEQNYVYDLVGSSALLQRYLDEQIVITGDDGTIFEGQLLSSTYEEIIIKQADGQIVVIGLDSVRDIRFPSLPEGLVTRPTLRWILNSVAGGSQNVELTYLTSGMNWTADYILLLATDNTNLNLNGWITLNNTSGATFTDAQVKLIAGDVNRVQREEMLYANGAVDMAAMPTSSPQVVQRDISEYKLYEIGRPVTVANNETKQVEFVTGADIPATTYYVYDSSAPFYGYYGPVTDQYYGQTGLTDVQNWLEFSTGEENGLGADLPAGRVRVYQEDVDGAALLIGENTIDHTPEGEMIRFKLGNAFDLVGERIQTSFQYLGSNVLEETYQITLRNRKEDATVQIRVPEHLSRWSNWEILNASAEYTQTDSATIEFRVDVPPGGETVITYTVRYTWSR